MDLESLFGEQERKEMHYSVGLHELSAQKALVTKGVVSLRRHFMPKFHKQRNTFPFAEFALYFFLNHKNVLIGANFRFFTYSLI